MTSDCYADWRIICVIFRLDWRTPLMAINTIRKAPRAWNERGINPFHTRASELGGLCLEASEGVRQAARYNQQTMRDCAWQSDVFLGKIKPV